MRQIRSRKLAQLRYVERNEDYCNMKKITNWKPTANRLKGRSQSEWLNDLRKDLKRMKLNL